MGGWRAWYESGLLVDIALAAIVVELIALIAYRRVTGTGMRALDVLGQLLAGACLLGAVRCAVSGARPEWTVLLLTASFPAHMWDLARRARQSASRQR